MCERFLVVFLLLAVLGLQRAVRSQNCRPDGAGHCDFEEFMCGMTCLNISAQTCFIEQGGHNDNQSLVLRDSGYIRTNLTCPASDQCFTLYYKYSDYTTFGYIGIHTRTNDLLGKEKPLPNTLTWKLLELPINEAEVFYIQISANGTATGRLYLDTFVYRTSPCSVSSATTTGITQSSTVETRPSEAPSNRSASNEGLIIGVTVAAFLVCTAIIVVVLVLLKKGRSNRVAGADYSHKREAVASPAAYAPRTSDPVPLDASA